jgi:hypothetical protein
LVKKNDNYTISLYNDKLTTECIIENTAKIEIAFPSLKAEFHDLLQKRLKEKGFTDKRLTDSVNNVIDNCIYPTPTIANFLNFNKDVEIYTYQQLVKMNDEIRNPFQFFTKIDIGIEKPMYIRNEYFEKYNFVEWKKK